MHTMHLLPGVAIQPNLELKTPPKLVLGSLPLAFVLPALCYRGMMYPLLNMLGTMLNLHEQVRDSQINDEDVGLE